MNTNALRSVLNLLSGGAFISVAMSTLGCTGDLPSTVFVEPTTCAASWLPVEYQAFAGTAFVVLGFLMKMFGGSGATVAQNIAAPVVPVVTEDVAGPGTVTPAQVAAP